jgi:hypothetical protein
VHHLNKRVPCASCKTAGPKREQRSGAARRRDSEPQKIRPPPATSFLLSLRGALARAHASRCCGCSSRRANKSARIPLRFLYFFRFFFPGFHPFPRPGFHSAPLLLLPRAPRHRLRIPSGKAPAVGSRRSCALVSSPSLLSLTLLQSLRLACC